MNLFLWLGAGMLAIGGACAIGLLILGGAFG